jgi:hypothetical protein
MLKHHDANAIREVRLRHAMQAMQNSKKKETQKTDERVYRVSDAAQRVITRE